MPWNSGRSQRPADSFVWRMFRRYGLARLVFASGPIGRAGRSIRPGAHRRRSSSSCKNLSGEQSKSKARMAVPLPGRSSLHSPSPREASRSPNCPRRWSGNFPRPRARRPGGAQLPGGRQQAGRRACDGRVDGHPGFAVARESAKRCPGRDHHDTAEADEPSGRSCPQRNGRTGRRPDGRGVARGKHLAEAQSRRLQKRTVAHCGRRLVPDARQPAGRIAISGGSPCAGVRADPLEMDHDRPGAQGLAALHPEAIAHAQRTGRRSPGQAAGQCRGFPVGRRARADLYQNQRGWPVRAGRLHPGAGISLRTRRGLSFFRPPGQTGRGRDHGRTDTHQRPADAGDADAPGADSPGGIARPGAAIGRTSTGRRPLPRRIRTLRTRRWFALPRRILSVSWRNWMGRNLCR